MTDSSLPSTTGRDAAHTAKAIDDRIRRETEERVRRYAEEPNRIQPRLRELDQEWNVERTLEANAATLALAGTALAAAVDRRWLALPAAVSACMLLHALQGWCPALPVFRRMGIRTSSEIEFERQALKAVRGDFKDVQKARDRPREALAAVARGRAA